MSQMLNIAVTGDVDSGKSTLIGRLLHESGSAARTEVSSAKAASGDFEFAYLLDSLKEERSGKLTIDTTQAFCTSKKGRELVFIDVPGHRELFKNMLTGSSYADIAIFVVDMARPLSQQDKRHIFILKFLGVEDMIFVFNKMDAVNFNEELFLGVKNDVSELLAGNIGVTPRHFIPISARLGENLVNNSKNMPWYRGLSLFDALDAFRNNETAAAFRFIVQDNYAHGPKTVAAGRIISGSVKKGEQVVVLPRNQQRRVCRIKILGRDKNFARAPENVGLVLDDMNGISRGQVLCKAPLPEVRHEIRARVFCVRPLGVMEDSVLKCLTQQSTARIRHAHRIWDMEDLGLKRAQDRLEANSFSEVDIITDEPVVVEKFGRAISLGRFIIENNKDIQAVGAIF